MQKLQRLSTKLASSAHDLRVAPCRQGCAHRSADARDTTIPPSRGRRHASRAEARRSWAQRQFAPPLDPPAEAGTGLASMSVHACCRRAARNTGGRRKRAAQTHLWTQARGAAWRLVRVQEAVLQDRPGARLRRRVRAFPPRLEALPVQRKAYCHLRPALPLRRRVASGLDS